MDDESLIEFRKYARNVLMKEEGTRRESKEYRETNSLAAFKTKVDDRLRSIWWNRLTSAYIVALPFVVVLILIFPKPDKPWKFFGKLCLVCCIFAGVLYFILWISDEIRKLLRKKKSTKTQKITTTQDCQDSQDSQEKEDGNFYSSFKAVPLHNIIMLSSMVLGTIAVSLLLDQVDFGQPKYSDGTGKRVLFALGVPAAISFVLAYIFIPQYMRRTSTLADLNTFAYGEGRDGNTGYLGLNNDENKITQENIRLGYLRTFDVETTINLDDAMANMREAIGYNVTREEDTLDPDVFINDVIVPRILATKRPASYDTPSYKSDEQAETCKERIDEQIEKIEDDTKENDGKFPKDSQALRELDKMWRDSCKPGIFDLCRDDQTGSDLKTHLKCDAKLKSALTFDDFMWKPKGVEPEKANYAEQCFDRCTGGCDNNTDCTAAVYEDGLCYIQTGQEWEVDTKAEGARVYVPTPSNLDFSVNESNNKCGYTAPSTVASLPVYTTGDAVEEILNDIQTVAPITDMTDIEDAIREALKQKDPNGDYDQVISALIRESALRSDDRTPLEDGGNLKADLEVAREYFETTKLNKFNQEIAWPIVKAGVNISARNRIFDRIVGRRMSIFHFYHFSFVATIGVATISLFVVLIRKVGWNILRYAQRRPYPTIPFMIFVVVFLVSIMVLLERRRLRFLNNIRFQAENAANFGASLTELSNFFSSYEYATDRRPEDPIEIPEGLQVAVFENDMAKARLKKGSSLEMVDKVYDTKDRARMLRKMAKVLEEYDKCNNVMYRGGVPFPTALVTAYMGLIALGIGLIFSVPEINPTRIVANIELARALSQKASEARLEGLGDKVAEYTRELCELWTKTVGESTSLKNVMQNTSVFLSVIFGLMYIVKTAEDTHKFTRAVQSGIVGIVGDCV